MSTTTEAAPKKEPEPTAHHDSQEEEYESAEEIEGDYDEEDVEEIEIEEEVEEEEEIEEEDEEDDEDDLDPSLKEKPLDDDEDRKNPQFIPKKGYFYEHDDRTRAEEENGEEPAGEEPVKEEKPKKPSESINKWSHDRFDESEQAPKSREELQTTYGYDIRSEDQPPRARRRRRYGRGPTKYTRRWEEEEAYQKQPRGGFRGRGRGGFSRGSGRDRRHDSRDEYDEEFPELGGEGGGNGPAIKTSEKQNIENKETQLNTKLNAPVVSAKPTTERYNKEPLQHSKQQQDSGKRFPNREINERSSTGGRDFGRDRPPPRRNVRDQDRENDNYNGGPGGRGGGRGGRGAGMMNRRGRRNEFTNRNRYPNRRDDGEYNDSGNSNTDSSTRGGRTYSSAAGPKDPNPSIPKSKLENNNRRGEQRDFRSVVNGTNGESKQKHVEAKHDKPPQQQNNQPQQHRIPPFTNTEYPVPGKGNINSHNSRSGAPLGANINRPQGERHNNVYPSELVDREPHSVDHVGGGEPQKEVRDLREKLNAMRMQKGYQNQNQNDRRSQMPPRLQQQQAQQPVDPTNSKPRRYSTQRERTVQQQPAIVTSGTMVIPNTVAPAAMTQGVPNIVPVVTMSEGVVPSTVAAYQPTNYYGETQVYEASGSPVTGNGPSVSPSLWNPHANAYATAPYPSPPTAPQVPPAPYADPTAFIGPGGAPIYAAPPQFLQDPSLMNYSGPAPPFPPPYHAHPQGYQGYAQVTPAPPPEVYHGGVTYYSTQNQIQRPPMMAVQKRPKSVLQLVEPPEKSKSEKGLGKEQENQNPQHNLELTGATEAELSKKLEATSLEPRDRKPSPLREFTEETSWAAEMEELTSPTEPYPEENHFGVKKEDTKRAPNDETSATQDSSATDKPPLENIDNSESAN